MLSLGTVKLRMSTLAPIFLALAFAISAQPAAADMTPTPKPKRCKSSKDCKRGYRCKRRTGKCCRGRTCVPPMHASYSDEELYRVAVWHIKKDDYATGLRVLKLIKNKKQAKVLVYMGYATRHSGDVDAGIRYYYQALALDPNFDLAREYLGEGYLQKGDALGAKAQLAEIGQRCGKRCDSYRKLAGKIAEFEARRKS